MPRFAVEVTATVVSETVIYVEADDGFAASAVARRLHDDGKLTFGDTKGESSVMAYAAEMHNGPYYTADGTLVEGDADG